MHILIATDGSRQSLASARYVRSIVDPKEVTRASVVAVISPLAAVPFATEGKSKSDVDDLSFRKAAETATQQVADELQGWGPQITRHVYSGQPSAEIVKAATRFESGLIVIASQSTRTRAVLMGSVAHRVMNQAPCPVLVHRNSPRKRSAAKK